MANKSIFEVDVDDAKFKAFLTKVQQYQQTVKSLPGQWAKVNAAQAPIVHALAAQTQIHAKILEGEKRVAQEAERAERSWRGISSYTNNAASNLARMTVSLAKWAGLGGALVLSVEGFPLLLAVHVVPPGGRMIGGVRPRVHGLARVALIDA